MYHGELYTCTARSSGRPSRAQGRKQEEGQDDVAGRGGAVGAAWRGEMTGSILVVCGGVSLNTKRVRIPFGGVSGYQEAAWVVMIEVVVLGPCLTADRLLWLGYPLVSCYGWSCTGRLLWLAVQGVRGGVDGPG